MRFLLYNIRYATGGHRRPPWSGYLKRTGRNLKALTDFIKPLKPDVVGLVEVDAGSYRSGRCNQAETIAAGLGHYHCYMSKYGTASLARRLPILKQQGNAFLSCDSITNETFHYFKKGFKRLVIELELEAVTIFLVHLAVGFRVRHHQLRDLYALVKNTRRPHIVAGDFNSFWGDHEIELFLAATGLRNANDAGAPSFPSWAPKRQLDFILYSPEIRVERFCIPRVTYSDHLPLVCDIAT